MLQMVLGHRGSGMGATRWPAKGVCGQGDHIASIRRGKRSCETVSKLLAARRFRHLSFLAVDIHPWHPRDAMEAYERPCTHLQWGEANRLAGKCICGTFATCWQISKVSEPE